MDILQSVAIEISLWETFAGARGANATVFLLGLNLSGWIIGTYEGHAGALAALDMANGDLDIGAGSLQFIENTKSGNMLASLGGWMFYLSGLLIAVLPLWISNDN